MLDKKVKRMLALALASVLAVSAMTACGKEDVKESTATSESKTESVTSESVAEEVKEFTYPADTDTKLTYWTTLNANVSKSYPTLNESPFAAALNEATGIEVEYVHPPQGQEKEQLGILVGSGELPDMIETNWSTFSGGVDAAIGDTIIDLTEAIDKWAPNLKAYLDAHPEVDRLVKNDDGKYYCFPTIVDAAKLLSYQTNIVRQDWLDKLGLDAPETKEDWYEMLTKFKSEMGAETPLAPTSIFNNNITSGWNVSASLYLEGDKVVYGPYTDNWKAYLTDMSQWHTEGLLGNAVATTDSTTAKANFLTGVTGAYVGAIGSNMGSFISGLEETTPEASLVALPPIAAESGKQPEFGQMSNSYSGNGVAITTSCEDVEMAVRFLDFGYSEAGNLLYNFGVEGESYNMVGDYPTYTDLILKNPDGNDIGSMIAQYARGNYSGPFVQREEYIEQYYQRKEQQDALVACGSHNMKEHIMPPLSFTADENAELAEIQSNIDTYMKQMRLKFITGVESLDKWDEYIKTLEDYGVKRMIEINQAAYDRFLSK